MKRKLPAPRNTFAAAALFRKAGAHRKTKKVMRRAEKVYLQGSVAQVVEKWAFPPKVVRSSRIVRPRSRESTKAMRLLSKFCRKFFPDRHVGKAAHWLRRPVIRSHMGNHTTGD